MAATGDLRNSEFRGSPPASPGCSSAAPGIPWFEPRRGFGSKAVQAINQLAQPAVGAAVETEGDAGQRQELLVLAFFGGGFDDPNGIAGDDLGEVLVQCRECSFGGSMLEADDEQVADEPARVLIPVEPGDPAHRLLGAVGDLVEVEILG